MIIGVEAEAATNRLASKIKEDELLLEFDQEQQRYTYSN